MEEFFHGGYYDGGDAVFSPEKKFPAAEKNGDNFIVEELLLDLPNDDVVDDGGALDSVVTGDSSTVTASAVENSSFSGDMQTCHQPVDGQFASDDCFPVPYDEWAELEWLSNIVEEPFSSEDMEKMQLISGIKARNNNNQPSQARVSEPDPNPAYEVPMFRPNVSVPGKARSKRSRSGPGMWASKILPASPPDANAVPTALAGPTMSSSSESDISPDQARKKIKAGPKKKETHGSSTSSSAVTAALSNNSEGRKCLHCATDKTPQWRTGPMGPKTLCNACGVRYKSGRLVPEYRPAASPTFVLTKHSNSHRKVMEIRRQKELVRAQQHQQFIHQNMMFDVSNGGDFLIHQHVGPDFRQLI